MSIELTHQFNSNSQLAQDLIAQGANVIREEMFQIEDEVVAEVDAIIRADFDNSREGFRSKGEGHLLGSIEAEVTSPPGQFPVIVAVWSTQDEAKVASLEFGARPHSIFATSSDFLYFTSARIGRGKAAGVGRGRGAGILGPGFLTKGGTGSRGGSSKSLAKVPSVHHPGNRPHHFLRRGLDAAVRRRLGG